MQNAKVLGFVGLVTTFGVLVGCGGGGAPSPTLELTSANATNVASEALVDSHSLTQISLPAGNLTAFAPAAVQGLRQALARAPLGQAPNPAATSTTPCTGGGTVVTDGTDPSPTATSANETVTYNACVDGGTTTNGTLKASVSRNGNSLTLSISVNLTIKSAAATLTETGGLSLSLDASTGAESTHITSDGITVAVDSTTIKDKITLSNLDISEMVDGSGNSSATESYAVETTRLGGLFSVDTDTAVATLETSQHPHAGKVTITGGKSTKLEITILGDETFTPPAGQGQVMLVLNGGAAVYVSWADLEAAASSSVTNM